MNGPATRNSKTSCVCVLLAIMQALICMIGVVSTVSYVATRMHDGLSRGLIRMCCGGMYIEGASRKLYVSLRRECSKQSDARQQTDDGAMDSSCQDQWSCSQEMSVSVQLKTLCCHTGTCIVT